MYSENNKSVFLVLSPGFPSSETDTTCLPAQQSLIHSINKTHPEIKVIVLAFEYPHTTERYTWFGNEVIPFGGRNSGGIARLQRWIKIWRKLILLKKEYKIMGLLSFWLGQCAFIGKYFGKFNKLKHFTWILGQDARKGNNYIKWIRPEEGSLLAMSDFLADQLFTNYAIRPTHIIPNGIDTGLYQPYTGGKDIDIIGVGSLIPLKQYEIFIDVIKELKKQIDSLNIYLCGDGSEKNRLIELIQKYELEDTITLTGEKSHTEVLRLLQRSKIMLHPSSYEGFSGACLEALYAGAHVVSFQQPMNGWIRHWHITENKDEMIQMTKLILDTRNVPSHPVLPYRMEDNAIEMIRLFTV